MSIGNREFLYDLTSSALLTCVVFAVANAPSAFAALSCSVATTCSAPSVVVFRMSGTSNAHAELPSQSLYTQLVCCAASGASLSNSCSGTQVTVLKLKATTNSHVEENTGTTYTNNACLSVGSGFNVSVGYQANNCTGFDTTIASIASASGNSHVGDGTIYTTKVCGTVGAVSLTFTTTNQGFANTSTFVTPGTPLMATTTLSVTTNNTNGWNITLSGDNKSSTNNNLQRTGDTTVQITDQTEWVPGAATSTYGTGTSTIAALANGGNVLAFRVMTASSTNGAFFYAPNWWGTADNYLSSNANTVYAGISSSTVQRQIGNAGPGSLSASAHLNDVQYYLLVSTNQKNGAYTAPLTYTATTNP